MAITKSEYKTKAWQYLLSKIGNKYGVAGLMGNIQSESAGFLPNRVQFLCIRRYKEKGIIYTDESYTKAVDSKKISKAEFLSPLGKHYGYGLCQWTTDSRKAGLYARTVQKGKSIGDLEAQLEYLMYELQTKYPSTLKVLKNAKSIKEASDYVLIHFESPNNASALSATRTQYSQEIYNLYKNEGVVMAKQLTYDNWMSALDKVAVTARKENWSYGDSHGWPPCSDHIISCDRHPARALYDMGYTDQPRIPGSTSGITVNNVNTYLPKYGFVKITNPKDIKKGAIVCVGQSGNTITHVFTVTEYNPSTQICNKYDMGSQERIRTQQPFKNVKLVEWPNRHFICAFNLPNVEPEKKNYLSKGDKGDAVKKMQRHLNEVYGYDLAEDGDFGTATENAVKDFQKRNGLTVDGQYGVQSKAVLDKQVTEKRAAATQPTYMTDFSAYKGKISNSGHDERGKYSGGTAGDQTGTEWQIINWYNRPWNVMLRFEDSQIANLIAELSIEAANNNKIGYDQNQRTTFWTQLSKSGYRPKNITVSCEADCSAGVAAIVKAVGYLLNKQALKNVSPDAYTGNLKRVLTTAGAKAYTASKYLTSSANLKPGDILLYEGHHTAISLGGGSASSSVTPSTSVTPTPPAAAVDKKLIKIGQQHLRNFTGIKLAIDGSYGPATQKAFIIAIQYGYKNSGFRPSIVADGEWGPETEAALKSHPCQKGQRNLLITALQAGLYINSIDPNGLQNPGNFGPGLEAAVKQFQKQAGLEVDGIAGAATFKKLAKI